VTGLLLVLAPVIYQQLTERPAPAALGVHLTWPTSGGCDLDTAAAMPAGGRPVRDLHLTYDEDPRTTAVRAGAASWETGSLGLTLTNSSADPIHVASIRPQVRSVEPKARFAWVLRKPKGCGGPAPRYLRYDLDHDRFTVRDGDRDIPYGSPRAPAIPGMTVTRKDPAYIYVAVRSCAASYRWNLTLTYTIGNRQMSRRIDLRSAGGVAGVPIYDVVTGSTGTRRLVDTHRVTSAKCRGHG